MKTLFKQSSDTVIGYAENAYKTAGMSANEYMNTVTSFSASLLQSLGGDTAAAAEYAQQAITDMSDNANKMGTDITMIQNAYQGFAKQNYTMLDNLKLGYGGTQAEMYRLMQDAEELGAKFNSEFYLSEKGQLVADFADITAAIHVIQTEMGITGTTAKEASSTIQGSIASMSAAWQNFIGGMADPEQDFDALVGNLIDSVVTVGERIITRIKILLPRLTEGLTQLVQGLLPQVPGIISDLLPSVIEGAKGLISGAVEVLPDLLTTAIESLPSLGGAAVSLIGNLISAIATSGPQVLGAGMELSEKIADGIETGLPNIAAKIPNVINRLLSVITQGLPEFLNKGTEIVNSIVNGIIGAVPEIANGLPALITGIVDFISENQPKLAEAGGNILVNLITGLIEAVPQLIEALPTIIQSIVDGIGRLLPLIIETGVNLLIKLGDGIISAIPDLVSRLPEIVNAIIDGITSLLGGIVDVGKNIVRGLWDGISSMGSWLLDKVTGLFDWLFGGVEENEEIHSPSRKWAKIGEYDALGMLKGWEAGLDTLERELTGRLNVRLSGESQSGKQSAALGANIYITVNMSGGDADSGRKIGQQIARELRYRGVVSYA